jgi:diguanylate cyclase (GGDEF)-like protein/PAS domain S-box-containing protein
MDEHFHADFYGFVIDSEQGLSFAGKPVSLRPKELQMLLVLVSNAGKRISKDVLIEQVWNGNPTSDESISRCLSILKSTLRNTSPGAEQLIKTEYGQGYRFIGEIGRPATFVNEENFFLLINATRNIVILEDGKSRWQIANHACLDLFGLTGKPWQGKTSAELVELCDEQWRHQFATNLNMNEETWKKGEAIEFRLTSEITGNNGTAVKERVFEINKIPIFEVNGSRKALITLGQEITDRLENQRQERLIKMVMENSDEAVLVSDQNNNIVYVNQAFTKITGYRLQEVVGKNPRIFASGRHDQQFYSNMWQKILTEGTWHGEIWDKRKNGEIYPKWVNISTVHDNEGSLCNYVAIFSDITKQKADEEMLWFLAYHDPLTKLPNRLLLNDRFDQAISNAKRHGQGYIALLYLDLDNFKTINDTLGHEVGDRLLVAAAQRLQATVRDIDTVSRVGGDEFVIILTDMPDSQAVALVAQNIIEHLSRVYEIGSYRLTSTISVGIALHSIDGEFFEELLTLADTAMYHAKDSGRNTYRFYTDKMNVDALERLRIRNELAEAIELQQFELYYQPQYNLTDSRLVAFEALLRWNHPEKGMILPERFIYAAELTGQIVPIGEWVVAEACRQAKQWQDQGFEPVRIAVNLSTLHFKRGDIVKMITDQTERYALDPQYLELELTEPILLQEVDYIHEIMKKFKSLHFTLSIDDFGTGYSSLSILKKFRVDKLKIDGSFVRNLEIDSQDLAIVRSIIQIAKGFGMHTIAEGVETEGQLEILRSEGCHEGQGYIFSHPLPAVKIESILIKR